MAFDKFKSFLRNDVRPTFQRAVADPGNERAANRIGRLERGEAGKTKANVIYARAKAATGVSGSLLRAAITTPKEASTAALNATSDGKHVFSTPDLQRVL